LNLTNEVHILGRLTTHVLDTSTGTPARRLKLSLFRIDGTSRQLLKDTATNDDGRCDGPLLEGGQVEVGTYEIVFQTGAYFAGKPGVANPPFLNEVPVRFTISDASAHYHVPLLVSPWSYSTYRGS